MKKKIFSVMLALVMVFNSLLSMTASAAAPGNGGGDTASPMYQYTSSVTSRLTINGKTATCESKATGTTSSLIEADQYLERHTFLWWYETVGQWGKSTTTKSLTMTNTKSNLTGGVYRVRTVFKVYNGTKYETIEVISDEVTI
ncbi:MAG: hypothetical protein J1E39_09925 [Eubacterium sp.]|nr:hypothetical protein [Eubacterium sp.]